MSLYEVKPYSAFSRRSDFMEPLSRQEYEKRARVVTGANLSVGSVESPFASDKVDISSATGRESLLYKLRQKYGSSNTTASLLGSLTPVEATPKGLYSGVGAMSGFINSFV